MVNEERRDIAIKYALTSITHLISEVKRSPESADNEMLLVTIETRYNDLCEALLRLGETESSARTIADAVMEEAEEGAVNLLKEMDSEQLSINPQAHETLHFIRQALRKENLG